MTGLTLDQKVEVYCKSYCGSKGVTYKSHKIEGTILLDNAKVVITVAAFPDIELPLPKELL